MDTFKRILSYAKPWGRYAPGYLLLSILSVIFGIINYALLGPLLTVLFESDTISASAIAMPQFSLTIDWANDFFKYLLCSIIKGRGIVWGLAFVALSLSFACFLANLCRYLSQRILVGVKTNLMRNIRKALYHKISSLHIGYFNARRKGDILSSISNDVNEVQNSVASSFHIIFRDPLLVIGFLLMLFYMSPRLTLVSLIALPISAFVVTKITRKLRSGSIQTQTLMGRILSQFDETISGARIIKAFNAQKYVEKSFDECNEAHRKISRSIFNRQEMASPTSEFLGISIAAIVLFYGGWLNLQGKLGMTWPEFIVYIGFYWRVLEPAKAISNAYANIRRGMVSAGRILDILDVENKIEEAPSPVRKRSFDRAIEFKNVSFAYENEEVLHNISLTIPKGKMVAIVGPSGAGKSTMVDLLPRFWDVTGGAILLDGVDIRQYKQEDLISLMGIVTQESILFNDTVYNNITFGLEHISEEQVIAAAKVANAHEFIVQMSEGYQTNIGDRGAKLSGGQRQRIAIARAVLKNPPIMILDEATSALDTESERLVQDALANLMKNRTSLVIAHRLSTIRYADEIVVVQNGSIVERGSHDILIENHGLYSHLCELQAFS